MIQQTTFTLRARARGFHLVTDEVLSHLPALPRPDYSIFLSSIPAPDCRSTKTATLMYAAIWKRYSITWCANASPGTTIPWKLGRHACHAKSSLVGASLSIPITDGRLNLGTWQGIYLCEFRNHGGGRRIVATILGE